MTSISKSRGASDQDTSRVFDKIAKEIARRDLLQEFEFLPHNSKLYTVEKNWKAAIIRDDPKVKEVGTLLDFERAVCDPDVVFIYIPSSALISNEGIHRVCARNATEKTILKEAQDD